LSAALIASFFTRAQLRLARELLLTYRAPMRKISQNHVAQIFFNSYNYSLRKHVAQAQRNDAACLSDAQDGNCFLVFVARSRVGLSTSGRQTDNRAGTFVRRTNSGQEEEGCQEGWWSKEGRQEKEVGEEEVSIAPLSLAGLVSHGSGKPQRSSETLQPPLAGYDEKEPPRCNVEAALVFFGQGERNRRGDRGKQ
jgi:hypothetical protein